MEKGQRTGHLRSFRSEHVLAAGEKGNLVRMLLVDRAAASRRKPSPLRQSRTAYRPHPDRRPSTRLHHSLAAEDNHQGRHRDRNCVKRMLRKLRQQRCIAIGIDKPILSFANLPIAAADRLWLKSSDRDLKDIFAEQSTLLFNALIKHLPIQRRTQVHY